MMQEEGSPKNYDGFIESVNGEFAAGNHERKRSKLIGQAVWSLHCREE